MAAAVFDERRFREAVGRLHEVGYALQRVAVHLDALGGLAEGVVGEWRVPRRARERPQRREGHGREGLLEEAAQVLRLLRSPEVLRLLKVLLRGS
ncbi:MAG: hypothetical protein M0031_01800 [Thermaerobacter sp.]|nr:hypothetical protein [Thermaerobacter sp.]